MHMNMYFFFFFPPMSSRFISYAKTPHTRTRTEKMYERRFGISKSVQSEITQNRFLKKNTSEMNEVFLSAGKDSL